MKRYHNRTNNSKTIFDEDIENNNSQTNYSNYYQPNNYNNNQTNYNDNPIINEQTDNIHLTSENFKPNQALIDITGFNDIAAFINSTNDKSHTMKNKHDNTFDDYNEDGKNNINESSYRQLLIKQMTDSVFQQSQSMFGDMKQTSKSSRRNPENQYDVDSTYTPSKAPSLYLQKQSKRIFKDSTSHH